MKKHLHDSDTLFYLLSFVLSLAVIRCNSLSFFITCFHSLSLTVTRCYSLYHLLYHSLSFVVPLVVIRCHSLYHPLALVVTRCTTRLSCYKRSILNGLVKTFQSKMDSSFTRGNML